MKGLRVTIRLFGYIVFLILGGMPNSSIITANETPPAFPVYQDVLTRIEEKRHQLSVQYHQAQSMQMRAEQLAKARNTLIHIIENDVMPQWMGTRWDFNGTTEIPRVGSVACGYFVTTILQHAGFQLERVHLAQQPSELIIKSLTTESYIKRFSNASIEKFVTAIQKWGKGIYVVGLDIHTGFIVANQEGVFFIHSSYIAPRVVVREEALNSVILRKSKYRVIGKISADDALVLAWLQERAIPSITR